ncbi:MAG: Gfo/Idh/MocA family oxidoreductase [Candidatus Kapabacteria bacterium]|nr:Gfo/Idh/MocA family oxidoreductase [Ignavibacteriota bacterium]MCW5883899.1 Gfo/Idh/MocA family oxidoreductase [Candidatus Kapabacteria bacterium]
MKLKIGVIGVGHLGSIHARLLAENPEAELLGVRDILPERNLHLAAELNVKAYQNLEEIINECDALVISVPTSLHYEVASKCIAAGKHCLIEKPITAKYSEAVALIDEAHNRDVLIQVGHVERFNPALAAVKSYDLKPLFIESHRLGQFKPRARDVSVIHDLMIHDIDIILQLVNSEVKSIDANGVNVLTDTTDIANARITFENGCVANITASRISAHPMRKMRIFQKDAYLSLDFQEHKVEVYRIHDSDYSPQSGIPATMLGSIETGINNKNIYFEIPQVIKTNAIAEEQTAFIRAIKNEGENPVGADEAALALKVAEEIIELIYR